MGLCLEELICMLRSGEMGLWVVLVNICYAKMAEPAVTTWTYCLALVARECERDERCVRTSGIEIVEFCDIGVSVHPH